MLYLQPTGDYKSLPKDSVIKKYETIPYKYTIRPADIISVNLASLTDKEFNFFQKYAEDLGPVMSTYNARLPSRGQNAGNQATLAKQQIGLKVNDTGFVQLPILGLVKVQGLTIDEAENNIRKIAEGYFEDPIVRINLLSFQFTILGEIQTEGLYSSYDPEITLFEAITIAGNFNEFADRAHIKIIRTEGNIEKVIYVDLLEEKFLSSPYYYLKPNDLIIVPPLHAKVVRKYGITNYTTALGIISAALLLIFTFSRLKL